LHDWQGPLQATLQHTPSVQWLEAHSSSAVHTAPPDFWPQLPFTQRCPTAQVPVQVDWHLLVAGSHE